jgi:hypothetical protein
LQRVGSASIIVHYIFILGLLNHYQLQNEIMIDEWQKKPNNNMQTSRLPTSKFTKALIIYKNIYKVHLQK